MKAEGGWSAVCTEYCAVSPDSDDAPYVSARLWDDADLRALALLCDEAHKHGALAGIELWHGGVHAENRESRWPLVAPSQSGSPFIPGNVAKAMERSDIRRVQADWVAAAQRAAEAGFDIVYVYGGHGYLPLQFLSPVLNRRGDEYGGSRENRARFWLETIEAVREAVGERCAIAVRLSIDSLGPAGPSLEEGLAFVRLADPLVDLWDVTAGSLAGQTRVDSGTSRYFPEGYQLGWSRSVKEVTTKPVVGVGRFTSPDLMAEAVSSGALDLVGGARPSIADPFLPLKIEQGRYGEIRECIGCNACYSRAVFGGHLGCTQNATAGEEHRRDWHSERFDRAADADRDVLVVGAGPAGMECAIVLGKRGFERVHLVEAAGDLGGSLRWIAQLPGLGEWARVVNWRTIQLERLGNVEVIRGARLTADDVLDYGAAIVVVATGAHWSGSLPAADPGATGPPVLTPEPIVLEGARPPGKRVVVYDGEGAFVASSVAELLAVEGYEVSLTTPFDVVSPESAETLDAPFLRRRLHEAGVAVYRNATLLRSEPGRAIAEDEFGSPLELECDGIVLCTQRLSDDALYHALAGAPSSMVEQGIEALYRIGDCVSPRPVADAVFDGHRLGRELDGPEPALPQPHRRERVVAGSRPPRGAG